MDPDATPDPSPSTKQHPVTHLSRASRTPLPVLLGGSEATRMTPELANTIATLDEPLLCRLIPDQTETEIRILDRYLDILTVAELPRTGEEIPIAIENQYGMADPDHFGRLVGWYMPWTSATMGVLIAEGFSHQLVKAVNDGRIIRPEHGLWLIEATGYLIGDQPVITYNRIACSLPRADLIARERAFHAGTSSASAAQLESKQRADNFFEHVASTSHGWLGDAVRKGRSSNRGEYRWIKDNGRTCYVAIFVGAGLVQVGSCYLKQNWDEETLERLVTANKEAVVDPEPDNRMLRASWWDLRRDVSRSTPLRELPPDLGDQIERAIDLLWPAIDKHQKALLAAISTTDDPTINDVTR